MEILGWIANLLFLSGGFFKKPRVTMAHHVLADALYVTMYFYTGIWVAAISMLFTGLRTVLAIFLNEKQNIISIVFLTLLTSIIIIANMNHLADVLILLAGWCIALCCYFRDSIILYRLSSSISQILWILHSIVFEIYPMIFCCALILATNIYALMVHTDIFKKTNNEASILKSV